ncbi:MAG: Lpp/OprI family alanine-zipper lipoprotein [Gammaproteobacteria bacterium]|nr:Lpp/OprI family alanine-zipper lipoprotein [Gammaproteobacteria bacterium]MCY4282939.1 Lpp/OprI family alanine-zipper lipoprotein [Gammaproteobacteria bacterium]MCY4339476.1 Lpp/OprI family alanine-zipper lipoprotein [Gammaproteobacteria bacterium]
MKRALTKVTFFAAVLMMLGGCATVEQVDEAKSMAESAQAAAQAAAAAADSATAAANQAMDAARAAQAAADAANACCSENSSKLDRAIEEIMRK